MHKCEYGAVLMSNNGQLEPIVAVHSEVMMWVQRLLINGFNKRAVANTGTLWLHSYTY